MLLAPILRLKPDQSLAAASSALRARQREIVGGGLPSFLQEPFILVPASTGADPGTRGLRRLYTGPLAVVLAVTLLVLLICCATIGNLQLARATARLHDVAVERALGASAWQIARRFLIESLLLAGAGAVGGLAGARLGMRLILGQLSGPGTRAAVPLTPDWRVMAFAVAVSVLASVIFGVAPAWRAARTRAGDALATRSARSAPKRQLSAALVVVQLSLWLVLVVTAALFSANASTPDSGGPGIRRESRPGRRGACRLSPPPGDDGGGP